MSAIPHTHHVLGTSFAPPFPEGFEVAVIGMGCFWGAERLFWSLEGVHTTAVGYSGGHSERPSYREVCSGTTNHAEVVLVVHLRQHNLAAAVFVRIHIREVNDVLVEFVHEVSIASKGEVAEIEVVDSVAERSSLSVLDGGDDLKIAIVTGAVVVLLRTGCIACGNGLDDRIRAVGGAGDRHRVGLGNA
ncbi:MAG: hypothetical protein EBY93_06910 [Actinobacteria bacterium]|nr:hypothetical protein [Actinomycetota bacterium]